MGPRGGGQHGLGERSAAGGCGRAAVDGTGAEGAAGGPAGGNGGGGGTEAGSGSGGRTGRGAWAPAYPPPSVLCGAGWLGVVCAR